MNLYKKVGCSFLILMKLGFACDELSCMTIEEKVGQLLMAHFQGESVNEGARILIQDAKVGGVIYYNWANGLTSPQQVARLSSELQSLALESRSKFPLLIATDQEGGVVQRLKAGFTEFLGNRALAEAHDLELAEKIAFGMGLEMIYCGVNMNLAPVVDVNSNPLNPVIGVRSFSDDVDQVIDYGKKALLGLHNAQVITTLKHFPGYGESSVDPHEDLPVIKKSMSELDAVELKPFKELCNLSDAVMTAHILVPALDPVNCSTLSEITLQKLRNDFGFEGVIVADSLIMDGVIKKCLSVDEAAILALKAGCDLLILGGKLLNGMHCNFELTPFDVVRIHQSIVYAVQEGRVPISRLNDAVKRILKLKEKIKTENFNQARFESLKKDNSRLVLTNAQKLLKVLK